MAFPTPGTSLVSHQLGRSAPGRASWHARLCERPRVFGGLCFVSSLTSRAHALPSGTLSERAVHPIAIQESRVAIFP
ncbi:hypothetical protein BD311DRAFT_112553 [Dichomitus squalens]|uniref:Uncharacterized protein n=1 Tax=Dichomitus squalens TaxID=114155 RepID=A0A4Q9MAY5_9APHY|nr:hypothetical protein BD311DRAFT_112553 [Dichomitus squalens]